MCILVFQVGIQPRRETSHDRVLSDHVTSALKNSVLDVQRSLPIVMAQAGLLEWSNSIRFNMATDPGRQLFQDQIITYGFLFLDDYLDNILSGAKQELAFLALFKHYLILY